MYYVSDKREFSGNREKPQIKSPLARWQSSTSWLAYQRRKVNYRQFQGIRLVHRCSERWGGYGWTRILVAERALEKRKISLNTMIRKYLIFNHTRFVL